MNIQSLQKEHGTTLMDHTFNKTTCNMEIRNAIIYASYEFFDKNGSLNSIAQFFQEMRLKIQLFETVTSESRT